MAEMTWEEVRDAADEGYGLVLPVGSTEQHGPHLPPATDVLLPLAVAKGLATRTRVLIAPPIAYEYQSKPLSGGNKAFSAPPHYTERRLSRRYGPSRELIRSGFKKIIITNLGVTWNTQRSSRPV